MVDLVLGYDHGFGRGRSGDVETVRRLGQAEGFTVDVVDAVRDDGQPISSTVIRTAVGRTGSWTGPNGGSDDPTRCQGWSSGGRGGAGPSAFRPSM